MTTAPTLTTSADANADLARRADALLADHQRAIWTRTDHLFAGLLACEWIAGIVLAGVQSARTWSGPVSTIHPHLWAALVLGGLIVALPIYLVLSQPGTRLTRHAVAAAQMLMSALLIHVGDGRIEMHFHVFGSFAFLAFYRDWRVLVTGVLVVSVDHLARGLLAPVSVYGVATASGWRTLEHAGWVVFENVFLITACVQTVREMRGIAHGRALLEESHRAIELKVQERTRELKAAQDTLVHTARTAGMAEIATSVLHNVGNVLNSVNVSATVIAEQVRRSELPTLTQVSDLLREHEATLDRFLVADERGRMIPGFLADLATCLNDEQRVLGAEIESLAKGIDHIKQIVVAQQSMAKHSTSVRTPVDPARLFDAALTMQGRDAGRDVTFVRRYATLPSIELDEHRTLQILINLINNAVEATASRPAAARRVTLTTARVVDESTTEPRVRFSVADEGVGIAPEHLTRIFAHGFTTKPDGHGFGLHAAANSARAMGGTLAAASAGVGRGATFTLELPALDVSELASSR